jgi:hypothetical protein
MDAGPLELFSLASIRSPLPSSFAPRRALIDSTAARRARSRLGHEEKIDPVNERVEQPGARRFFDALRQLLVPTSEEVEPVRRAAGRQFGCEMKVPARAAVASH